MSKAPQAKPKAQRLDVFSVSGEEKWRPSESRFHVLSGVRREGEEGVATFSFYSGKALPPTKAHTVGTPDKVGFRCSAAKTVTNACYTQCALPVHC